jgi:hypothetical protein
MLHVLHYEASPSSFPNDTPLSYTPFPTTFEHLFAAARQICTVPTHDPGLRRGTVTLHAKYATLDPFVYNHNFHFETPVQHTHGVLWSVRFHSNSWHELLGRRLDSFCMFAGPDAVEQVVAGMLFQHAEETQ